MIAFGTYLRLRREAAGLSIEDVADLVSDGPGARDFNIGAIAMVERENWVPTPGFVDRLRRAFAFDRYILRQLICRAGPEPDLCRVCACSGLDACHDDDGRACGWATPAADLCTRCAAAGGAHARKESHLA